MIYLRKLLLSHFCLYIDPHPFIYVPSFSGAKMCIYATEILSDIIKKIIEDNQVSHETGALPPPNGKYLSWFWKLDILQITPMRMCERNSIIYATNKR